MGRTRPKCMGWAKPSPTTWAGLNPARVNSALHCSHATWTIEAWQGRSRRKKRGRKADLWWLLSLAELLEATGSDAGGSRWWQRLCFFLLSLSSIFHSLLCFFFFFCFQSSPSLLPSLFSSPFSSLLVSPVFIGKNRGEIWTGRPLCSRPSTTLGTTILPFLQHVESFGQIGLVGVFLRERWWWKTEEEKSSSSPTLRVQGKKKTHSAIQNGTVSGFFTFFLMNSLWNSVVWAKTRRFI